MRESSKDLTAPTVSAALLQTRALQSAILRSANFSIIATDPHGIIQLFNVGAEAMFGYPAAAVVDRVSPTDLHDPAEVLQRARTLSAEFGVTIAPGFEALAFKAARGIEDVYELSWVCADGSRFPAIVSISALRDDCGELIGYLLIGGRNSVRTRVEREFGAAMASADQASLAKSEFLSNMSHELRTPLNAILGFAQLIESGTPPPTLSQQRSLGQILKAGWYLLDLINEILDLALIESGKVSLSVEPLSLAEVLRESRAMIEPQAAKRGIRIEFPPLDTLHLVTADRTRVKQVLINLLSNAVKYNREGGRVTVTVAVPPERPGRLRISVADTGEGLSAAQLQQLFQPFNRLGQEAQSGEGTGIGLVVSKRLVELMGGRIEATSTVGVGSVFSIDLAETPAGRRRAAETPHAVPPRAAPDAGAPSWTLLYVEDNPANLMLVEDLLQRRPDVRLLSARDARSGIEAAIATHPDVILMDINLPGVSGIEALRLLGERPDTAEIPVIALSANASPRDIANGLEAGFLRYLTKPIKVPEFLATLDFALARSAGARPPLPSTGVAA